LFLSAAGCLEFRADFSFVVGPPFYSSGAS
jgi:hypothetical protein